ncbi:hypothetical protein [Paenibacillus graminis]|uniref:Uncharacterized protein n=1 Tax=Paenibacillus graminis TaxID=189425 RepID=A0A089M6U5_9BACL|nr:hypothetical protein [Paenibacillus graminis]AIQ69521.1 hypothetical protein PGRAT_19200 [Paenibacillus graminis]
MNEEMIRRIVREELDKREAEKEANPVSTGAHNFGIPKDSDYFKVNKNGYDFSLVPPIKTDHNHGQTELIDGGFIKSSYIGSNKEGEKYMTNEEWNLASIKSAMKFVKKFYEENPEEATSITGFCSAFSVLIKISLLNEDNLGKVREIIRESIQTFHDIKV